VTERVIKQRTRVTQTKSGVTLSADVIIDAALRLVGEHGGEALSVRRLGKAIGADPTAFYRYFATMDELLLELGDRLIGLGLDGFTRGPDWKQNLRALGLRTHAVYLQYPRVAMLVASRITGRPHEARIIELILAELRGAGFDDVTAVRLYRTFGELTLAFSAVDAAFLALPDTARAADQARWTQAYGHIDAATHPNIAELAPVIAAHSDMAAYESALDLLLDSFDRQLGQRPDGSR
jgi:AcrR family transcriptional regulator